MWKIAPLDENITSASPKHDSDNIKITGINFLQGDKLIH